MRVGTANGILFAIENLQDKPKGFYSMEDLLIPFFKLQENEAAYIKAKKKPWWQFWAK